MQLGILWLCHSCHGNGSDITSSINEIKSSIGQLSTSISSDLGKFLVSMTEMTKCITDAVKSMASSNCTDHNTAPIGGLSAKRLRVEHHDDAPGKFRRVDWQQSNQDRVHTSKSSNGVAVLNSNEIDNSRKSIVVSNVAPNVSTEHLVKYLAPRLDINPDDIRVTTLIPRSVKADELKFMQFRISIPASVYNLVRSHTLWPNGVRIRDFVFKRRRNVQFTSNPVADFILQQSETTNDDCGDGAARNDFVNVMDFTLDQTSAADTLQENLE